MHVYRPCVCARVYMCVCVCMYASGLGRHAIPKRILMELRYLFGKQHQLRQKKERNKTPLAVPSLFLFNFFPPLVLSNASIIVIILLCVGLQETEFFFSFCDISNPTICASIISLFFLLSRHIYIYPHHHPYINLSSIMHRPLSTLDTGSVLVPMSFSPSSTSGVLLRDCTLGDTVGAQEWIARELGRIREDTKPRHCRDYEALLQVIEEMSRYVPALSSTSNSPTSSNANKPSFPLSASSSTTQHTDNNDATFDVSISSTSAPHQSSTNNKPTTLLRFNDLEMALVHIIQYNQRCDLDTSIAATANASSFSHPARLLQTLDKLYTMRGNNGGSIGNPLAAQQHLFSILFGEVRLTSQLVAQWGIVCQWAKQLSGTQDWHGWMNFGLDAYAKAKQQCSTTTTGNDSSTAADLQSPTKSASSSSSSTTSTNREHQRMIEQLPMLLYNTHLVEEYQA